MLSFVLKTNLIFKIKINIYEKKPIIVADGTSELFRFGFQIIDVSATIKNRFKKFSI